MKIDALGVIDKIASGAALALALVPNEDATAFAEPASKVGDVVRTVVNRVKAGNHGGAIKRVNRWVRRDLRPALAEVVPQVDDVVPDAAVYHIGETVRWIACTIAGERYADESYRPKVKADPAKPTVGSTALRDLAPARPAS